MYYTLPYFDMLQVSSIIEDCIMHQDCYVCTNQLGGYCAKVYMVGNEYDNAMHLYKAQLYAAGFL